eukprot:1906797-Rhodomonas_salina.1
MLSGVQSEVQEKGLNPEVESLRRKPEERSALAEGMVSMHEHKEAIARKDTEISELASKLQNLQRQPVSSAPQT